MQRNQEQYHNHNYKRTYVYVCIFRICFSTEFPTLGNQLLRVVRVAGYNNKYLLCENLCLFLEVKYVILSLSLTH